MSIVGPLVVGNSRRDGSKHHKRPNPMGVSINAGLLFWGSYMKDPIVLTPYSVPLIFGNSQIRTKAQTSMSQGGCLGLVSVLMSS